MQTGSSTIFGLPTLTGWEHRQSVHERTCKRGDGIYSRSASGVSACPILYGVVSVIRDVVQYELPLIKKGTPVVVLVLFFLTANTHTHMCTHRRAYIHTSLHMQIRVESYIAFEISRTLHRLLPRLPSFRADSKLPNSFPFLLSAAPLSQVSKYAASLIYAYVINVSAT